MLNVTVQADSPPDRQPSIPEVKDLILQPRGTSQQIQMNNGKLTRSITYSFVVGSNKAGDYEIPAITVLVRGKEYTTQPLSLKVGASPNATPAGIDEEEETEIPGKYGHLRFQMVSKDRKHVYPGEIAPVRIQAYFPAEAQVSLSSMPRPEGSAFTLHNLSEKPESDHRADRWQTVSGCHLVRRAFCYEGWRVSGEFQAHRHRGGAGQFSERTATAWF